MAKTVQGSAFYDDNGGCIFTPYDQGKPENINWLPLKTVENGKLECSKNKVRMTLTMKRNDVSAVCSGFSLAFGKLISALMNDRKIKRLYEMAKNMKPCEVEEEEKKAEKKSAETMYDDDIPMHGY